MDEIIYLELDEEIPSIIDKMKKIEGKNIALVIPQSATIIQSVINLKILKKEAEELKKDLVLVTQDRIGRNLASQVGFMVYDNVNSTRPIVNPLRSEPEPSEIIELDLTEQQKRPPKNVNINDYQQPITEKPQKQSFKPLFRQEKIRSAEPVRKSIETPISNYQIPKSHNKKKKPWLKIILFIIALIGVAILSYFFIPRATINLVLQSEPFETKVQILADTNIKNIEESKNAIPGKMIEVESEETKTAQSTGTKDLGEKASGSLKLTNGTGDAQTVPEGTEFVAAGGFKFIATQTVSVPAATATVDSKGNINKQFGTANINVIAKEAGDKYNIDPTSFSGGGSVSAESTAKMSGGVSKKIKIVTNDDINNAKQELKNDLIAKNKQKITDDAGKEKFIDSTIYNEEVSFSANQAVGTQADSFDVIMKLKSKVIAYNENDYQKILTFAINKNVPQNKEVILSASDSTTTDNSNIDFASGNLKMEQDIKTHVGTKIDEEKIKTDSHGKKKSDVELSVKQIPGVKSVNVDIRPSWWPLKSLPTLRRNIQINRTVDQN